MCATYSIHKSVHVYDVLLQVKWVMNGLFRFLRADFDLQESYSGESVLKTVLSTIKVVYSYSEI